MTRLVPSGLPGLGDHYEAELPHPSTIATLIAAGEGAFSGLIDVVDHMPKPVDVMGHMPELAKRSLEKLTLVVLGGVVEIFRVSDHATTTVDNVADNVTKLAGFSSHKSKH
ncbi:hypothetical protein HY218_02680 [Candidatus Saccharibacteria bacterium]|nr:hypothetical protein [Candidatus Saccharibacteria bacterium]